MGAVLGKEERLEVRVIVPPVPAALPLPPALKRSPFRMMVPRAIFCDPSWLEAMRVMFPPLPPFPLVLVPPDTTMLPTEVVPLEEVRDMAPPDPAVEELLSPPVLRMSPETVMPRPPVMVTLDPFEPELPETSMLPLTVTVALLAVI